MRDIFGVAKISTISFGVLEIPDIFWGGGWTVDVGPEPTYEEKMRVPPPPPPPPGLRPLQYGNSKNMIYV